MSALSLVIPDKLVRASTQAAKYLGVSRTQFIKLAIIHELTKLHQQQQLEAMSKAFSAMRSDPTTMAELEDLERGFGSVLPDEDADWWQP